MNPGAEPRESASSSAAPLRSSQSELTAWTKVRRILSRGVFWSYERGSWQYDIIVLVILAFIFLTPTNWFHDRPRLQLSDLRHVQGIVQLSHKKNLWTFQVDARLVQSEGKPDLASVLQDLLRSRVRRPFQVTSVTPVKDRNGVILGYNVAIQTQ
jgi:hypothetical protein